MAKYEPITSYSGVNLNDTPRPLTIEEISDIVEVLPPFPCPSVLLASIYRSQIQLLLANDLKKIELCPSRISELKVFIVEHHMNSIHDRGTPIGLQSAEAYNAILTQLILNAFHKSGGAEASQGLDGVKDLTYARANPSDQKVFIHFNDPDTSMESIIRTYRSKLVGVTVQDLIVKSETFPVNVIDNEWWIDEAVPESAKAFLKVEFNLSKMYQHKITLETIKASILSGTGNSSNVKIFVSPTRLATMYMFLISESDDIANFIAMGNSIHTAISSDLKVKPLPLNFAGNNNSEDFDIFFIAQMTLLRSVVSRSFPLINIQGIQGINALQPVKMKGTIMDMCSEQKVGERKYIITLDKEKSLESGVSIEKIGNLLTTAGFEISRGDDPYQLLVISPENSYLDTFKGGLVAKSDDGNFFKLIPDYKKRREAEEYVDIDRVTVKRLSREDVIIVDNIYSQEIAKGVTIQRPDALISDGHVYVPVQIVNVDGETYEVMNILRTGQETVGVDYSELKPSDYIKQRISIEKNRFVEENKINPMAKRTPLLDRSMYVFAVARITKNHKNKHLYKQVLCLPYVNKKLSYVNNMHMLNETHGIENADCYIYNTFTNTLTSKDAYVNSSMTTVICDSITNKGALYGATFNGISGQIAGHMSLSSVEKASDTMISAAISGQKETLQNTTAAIYLGVKPPVGTGMFHVAETVVENGQKIVILDDELHVPRDDREKMDIENRNAQANLISENLHMRIRTNIPDQRTLNRDEIAYSDNYERYSMIPDEDVDIRGPAVRAPAANNIFAYDKQLDKVTSNSRTFSKSYLPSFVGGSVSPITRPVSPITRPVGPVLGQGANQLSEIITPGFSRPVLGQVSPITSRPVLGQTSPLGLTSRPVLGQTSPLGSLTGQVGSRPVSDFFLDDITPGMVVNANTNDAAVNIQALDNMYA